MTKLRTHYDNLKVARDAPPEVIRAAYKVLSQKYHPDRHQGDQKASQIMSLINASYEVLSDPEKRHQHNLWIAQQDRDTHEKGGPRPNSAAPMAVPDIANSLVENVKDYLLSFPIAWSMVVAPRSPDERCAICRRMKGMLVLSSYFVWALVILVAILMLTSPTLPSAHR